MKPAFFLLALGLATGGARAADLRIGIIGTDTSHATAFTKLLNDPTDKNHVPGGRVVVAFKGGSPDIESSWSRVNHYAEQLQTQYGVRIVDSIEALCREVDVVLLESVDGRPHLAQVRPVLQARKPVFVDKPVGGSLRDVFEIYRLARANGVPIFSSSAYRFYDSMQALKRAKTGRVRGAISYGPCYTEPHHPDFFWYGIHATEALFTVMGRGIETVARTTTADTDVAVGTWADGRTGVMYGLRGGALPHKVIVFGLDAVVHQQEGEDSYAPLVREIMKFFQTGVAPVPPEETLEIYAFMEAADESKRRGGAPVKIRDVVRKHRGTDLLPVGR
ncbi:MAG: Gfo/Idh/MocA family oxidoreductase [Verrucomicrobiales bacterium]|nr:Gfo/Idh/MocA family oxidoreductase [Verrucomicrobiales bacterium]